METFHRYRHYMGVLFDRRERWRLVVVILGSLVIAAMDTLSVLLIAPLVLSMGSDWNTGTAGSIADALGIQEQSTLMSVLLAATVGGFVLKDIITIGFNWWYMSFTARMRADAQIQMVDHYLHLPYYRHAHLGLPVIMRKTSTSVMGAYNTFAAGLISLVSQVLTVVAVSAALIIAAPTISLVLLALLAVASWVFMRVIRPVNLRIGREGLQAAEDIYNTTFDAFGAIKETQLRSSYDYFLTAVTGPIRRGVLVTRDATFLSALPKQLIEILFMLALAAAFAVSTVLDPTTNVLASLAVIVAGAFRLLPVVAAVLGSLSSIKQGAVPAAEFVADKLAFRDAATQHSATGVGAGLALTQSLRLEDIRFSYGEDQAEVLRGVNLTIPAGSTAAFVGSSGAGKSTLLDVIMGLQVPASGTMTVDGVDVAARRADWQRNIGVVPQEVFLTDRTIAENVAFDCDRVDIDEDLVRRCLAQADILDFVEAQPEGIWSSFGERGRRLSGGQRQRIGIARALYRQPSVLVLDEATSALDNETEARIADTIAALHGKITVIIVAHRLSTVRDADMIAFLAEGQVEATGTFAELQERSPGFRRLVDLASLEEHS